MPLKFQLDVTSDCLQTIKVNKEKETRTDSDRDKVRV